MIFGGVLTKHFSNNLEIMTELHDESSISSQSVELIFNLGMRYSFLKNITLLASIGKDVRNNLFEKINMMNYLGIQIHL